MECEAGLEGGEGGSRVVGKGVAEAGKAGTAAGGAGKVGAGAGGAGKEGEGGRGEGIRGLSDSNKREGEVGKGLFPL